MEIMTDEQIEAGKSSRGDWARKTLARWGADIRCRRYRPFPPGRVAKERDLGSEGTQTPENEEKRVPDSTGHEKAAERKHEKRH